MKQSIIINNLLIQYYFYKAKGSKTILFLHGWRSDSSVWNDLALRLNNDGISVYSLDLPGFGGSAIPKNPFAISDYAEIVYSFIKKVSIKKPILVGHSFGGRIAIKISATNKDVVDKLVLIDSAGFVNRQKQAYQLYAKMVKPLFKPKYMQGIRSWIYKKLGAEDYVSTPYLRDTFLKVIQEDLSVDLQKITAQTLIVWGENDNDTPVAFGEKMKNLIQGSKLVVIPYAGHFSFIDQIDAVYQKIYQFIR